MIRQSVKQTIAATFVVRVPDPSRHDFPTPYGTGFFVSPEGHFVTAYHVIRDVSDPLRIQLTHEAEPGFSPVITEPQVLGVSEACDLAILKVDFARHSAQESLKGKDGFDFLEIDLEEHCEGTPVYSFGYPLPESRHEEVEDSGIGFRGSFGLDWISARVTSAIISSRYEVLGPVWSPEQPRFYALDKAFNYGNSGGPIVLQETGKAIAVIVRFQPVRIQQPGDAEDVSVVIPSLYGVASSLRNIQQDLAAII